MATEIVTIPAEAIPDLRRMLAVGLASIAELERVQDAVGVAEEAGRPTERELHPVHPTGANEAASFAAALLWLDMAKPAEA